MVAVMMLRPDKDAYVDPRWRAIPGAYLMAQFAELEGVPPIVGAAQMHDLGCADHVHLLFSIDSDDDEQWTDWLTAQADSLETPVLGFEQYTRGYD